MALRELDSTGGRHANGRRHYVNPQPKHSSEERQRRDKRARANTIGAEVGQDGYTNGPVDSSASFSFDPEDLRSAHSDGDEQLPESPRSHHSEDELRPIEKVLEEIVDDASKEVHVRTRLKQQDLVERVQSLEHNAQAVNKELANQRKLLGTYISVFPPKGTTASALRESLTKAYWDGCFEGGVMGFVSEFEMPVVMQLVMVSCADHVIQVCRSRVPGCYPMLKTTSSVGPQENQCTDMREALEKTSSRYDEHANYTLGEWTFIFGFPVTRKPNERGVLGNSDDWSVEVVFVENGVEELAVLLTCAYRHDVLDQKYEVDTRVLDRMMWTRDDIRRCIGEVTEMYLPRVEWVGGEASKLDVQGKRKIKLEKGKGKGAFEGGGKPKGAGLLASAGIPNSMKGGGKQSFGGKQTFGGVGKSYGKHSNPGKNAGGYGFPYGNQQRLPFSMGQGGNFKSGTKGMFGSNGFSQQDLPDGKGVQTVQQAGQDGLQMASPQFPFGNKGQQGVGKGALPSPPPFPPQMPMPYTGGGYPDPYNLMAQMLLGKGWGS